MNPFLNDWKTPFSSVNFQNIDNSHFLPALEALIEKSNEEIEAICEVKNPDFKNTIEALDASGRKLGELSSVFFNLNSAETNDEIQNIAKDFSPKLSAFSNEISMNPRLFQQVKKVWEGIDERKLNPEQKTLLDKTYKRFVRNGALADSKTQKEIKSVDENLSKLKVQFGQNVLAETNDFDLILSTSME